MRDRGIKKNRKNKPQKPPRKPLSFGFIFSIFRIMSLVGFVLTLSAGFVFCHDIILQLPYFNIKNIDVTGMSRITRDFILEKTEINSGKNIMRVNPAKAIKILESETWIESAEVSMKMPDTVNINIKERAATALIDFDDFYIVDANGKVFKKLEDGDPDNLPIITGLAYQDTVDANSPGNALWITVQDVLKKGAEQDAVIPVGQIKRISADYQMGINLSLNNGPLIKLGSTDLETKLERISRIMHNKNSRIDYSKIESINLQNIDRIIVGFKKETPAEAEGKEV